MTKDLEIKVSMDFTDVPLEEVERVPGDIRKIIVMYPSKKAVEIKANVIKKNQRVEGYSLMYIADDRYILDEFKITREELEN